MSAQQRGCIVVPDDHVPGPTIQGSFPPVLARPVVLQRQLNRAAIRKLLRLAPKLMADLLIDGIFDESWSVRGGNDVIGLRHEIFLIVLEYLSGTTNQLSKGKWFARISTFDTPSVFELPVTELNYRGRRTAQEVLLRASPGGCSILGPSLRRAEESAAKNKDMKRLLIVFSDFELYDPDPAGAMRSMMASSADTVLAVSLNNPPPVMFAGTRVQGVQVVAGDPPADLANHIIEAARACAAAK